MTTIRLIDLETTGTEPSDAVVEIGSADILTVAQAEDIEHPPMTVVRCQSTLVNPGRPIPPETSAIHHIVDEDVAEALPFDAVVPRYLGYDADVFCAHNAKFERQWITNDLTKGRVWICTLRCAYRLWPDAPGHGNQTLRYWLNPEGLDRRIANAAYRAGPDAYVTGFILREMLKVATVKDLIEWSRFPALLPKITFGKHRGSKWSDVPPDYLAWIARQADMDEDVKFTAQHWLKAEV